MLDDLVAEFPDGRVLIVAHATLIRLLFCELAGMDPDGYRDLLPVLGNCNLTTIVYPWATESRAAHHPAHPPAGLRRAGVAGRLIVLSRRRTARRASG